MEPKGSLLSSHDPANGTSMYPDEFTAHLLTNKQTLWSRVCLETLTSSQLVKKFPAFYGTRRFITAFIRARHLSVSWARSIQSMLHPTSSRSILILSSHLCLGSSSGLFPQISPPKPCMHFLPPNKCPTHLIPLDSITQIIFGEEYRDQ